jgi:hypothetical protein
MSSSSIRRRATTFCAVTLVLLTAACAGAPTQRASRHLNLNPGTAGQDCAEDAEGNPVDVGLAGTCR